MTDAPHVTFVEEPGALVVKAVRGGVEHTLRLVRDADGTCDRDAYIAWVKGMGDE